MLVLSLGLRAQLLYRISGKGLEKDSYIFATNKIVPISYLDSVKDLFKCYNDCDVVVGEIVIDEGEAIKRMTHEAIVEEDITLLLSETEYALVDSAMQVEMGLSLNNVKTMRPAMLQDMYMMTVYEKLFEHIKGEVQMDAYFQRVAEMQGKKVKGLETIDDYINVMFRGQTLERQAKLLVGVVKGHDEVLVDANELISRYKNGDLEWIYKDFMKDTSEYTMTEGERFVYLFNRNVLWSNKLERMMMNHACFITVDALHLCGEDGLIELFKDKGFRVKAVK